jgi:Domain of unknown function (DUF4304)
VSFSKLLSQHFAEPLKKAGYKKTNLNWLRQNEETSLIINIQTSRWNDWAYVNFAVVVNAIENFTNPKQYCGHIRFRLQDVCPPKLALLISGDEHDLLTPNPKIPTESDAILFTASLKDYGIPFIEEMDTTEKLRTLFKEGKAGSQKKSTQYSMQLERYAEKIGLQ